MTTTSTPLAKPFYAVAGAGDAAVEQLRKLTDKVSTPEFQAKVREQVTDLGAQATEQFTALRGKATEQLNDLDGLRDKLRGQAAKVRARATEADVKVDLRKARVAARRTASDVVATAVRQASIVTEKATQWYETFAERGEQVVGNKPAPKKPAAKAAAPKAQPAAKAEPKPEAKAEPKATKRTTKKAGA